MYSTQLEIPGLFEQMNLPMFPPELVPAQGGGTSLQGYAKPTYAELVKKLGEPHQGKSGDGKVTVEWCFSYEDELFTVYDWKEGTTPDQPYWWHIGGTSPTSLHAFTLASGIDAINTDTRGII